MAEEQTTPKPETAEDLSKGLDALLERITNDTAGVRRGTMLTGLVGIVLAIVLFAYLGWLVGRLAKEVEPATLAKTISGTILPEIPKQAKLLQADLEKGAPKYVAMLFDAAEAKMPLLRRKAEEGSVAILNKLLEDLGKNTDAAIVDLIKKSDKAKMKHALDAAYAGKPEELEKYFTEELEEVYGKQLDTILDKDFYPMMTDIERRLTQLQAPDEKLTSLQQKEKELVTTLMFLINDAAVETAKK